VGVIAAEPDVDPHLRQMTMQHHATDLPIEAAGRFDPPRPRGDPPRHLVDRGVG
jgi:hypothetical protein